MTPTSSTSSPGASATGDVVLHVFVVENHPDTLKYLLLYLEQLGHRTSHAHGLQEALAALPGAEIDVLLSDIGLADGDGWELLQQANLPKEVYCIAMSGFGTLTDSGKSLAAGFRHHLRKPFLPRELEACLAEASQELLSRRG